MSDIRKALAEQLRAACGSVRTKSFPLSDLIQLMQRLFRRKPAAPAVEAQA